MRRLDELMKEKGASVHDLAELLGETYQKAWNRKNGRTRISHLEKKVIADWLEVPEEELEV